MSEKSYAEALQAIETVFSERDERPQEALVDLMALRGSISTMIEAMVYYPDPRPAAKPPGTGCK